MGTQRKDRSSKKGKAAGSNRSWKSLAQDVDDVPVTPFAWKRRALPILNILLVCMLAGGAFYGLYVLKNMLPGIQKAVLSSMGEHPNIEEISFETDGVLSESFIKDYLDLYEGTPLVEVDIFDIKAKLEEFEQIQTATVERSIDQALIGIRVTERHPVFKMLVEADVGNELRLVDQYGVSFRAHGYSKNTLLRLPAIGGVNLRSDEGRYLPIPEIENLKHFQNTFREMIPQWYAGVRSVVLQPKSKSSSLLGSHFVVRTTWCEALVLDEHALESQFIRLDRLLEGLLANGIDLDKQRLRTVDLSVDDRAIVRFKELNASPRSATRPTHRIL